MKFSLIFVFDSFKKEEQKENSLVAAKGFFFSSFGPLDRPRRERG
jgi:hypothetical protein